MANTLPPKKVRANKNKKKDNPPSKIELAAEDIRERVARKR